MISLLVFCSGMGLLNDDMRKSDVLWNNANLLFYSPAFSRRGLGGWLIPALCSGLNLPPAPSLVKEGEFFTTPLCELWLIFCVSNYAPEFCFAMSQGIFISYSRDDQKQALALLQMLRKEGYNVWIDQEAIPGASIWSDEIVQNIKTCDIFIALLSESSVTST